jgi:hypothetical protein
MFVDDHYDLSGGDSISSKATVSHFQIFPKRRITKHECLAAGDCV